MGKELSIKELYSLFFILYSPSGVDRDLPNSL